MSFPLINPILQFFDNSGNVLSGGKLFVYEPGTTTKKTTYSDENLSVANANPIILDSAGRCTIFLTDGAEYKFVLSASTDSDPPAAPIRTVDEVKSPSALTGANIGAGLWPRTTAEIAAGVTPTSYAYEPGDIRRYGAVLDGTTDDTTAVTNWAAVAGYHTFPVAQTAKITAAISLVSNSTYEFVAGARIQTATQNISLFSASSKTNIKIRGGHFKQTSAGNDAHVAGVRLVNTSHCHIFGCEFEGMQWAAIELDGSDNNVIENNHVHDSLASSAGDKFDIAVYHSNQNTIINNRLYGGQNGGVLIQDPLGSGVDVPTRNKVLYNRVGDHTVYGIVVYLGGSDPTYNEVIGNVVENIDGDPAVQAATGTGIYFVGSGLGGCKCHDNIVRNACIETTDATNGPGGITIADVPVGGVRVTVCGNTIEEMTQGHGILIVSSPGGAVVANNFVRMPSDNDGTGPGGATLVGNGIKVFNSSDVVLSGNGVIHNGTGDAVFVHSTSTSFDRISITGSVIRSAQANAIRFDRSSTFVYTDVAISGNNLRADTSGALITMAGCDRTSIAGNSGGANTGAALAFSACTATRITGNSFNTNSATGVTTTGTCTNSFSDRSNYVAGAVTNSGTGFLFEKLLQGTATYDPGNLVDGAGTTTTVTVTGAALGDLVDSVSFSNDLSGITVTGYVSAADTASVRFQNESGGALDLASGTLTVRVIKK